MGCRVRKCKICGDKFIPKSSRNMLCGKEECIKQRRKLTRDRNRKNREKRLAMEAKAKREKKDSLAEADAKAREEGLSYGQRELRIWLEQQRMERRKLNGR